MTTSSSLEKLSTPRKNSDVATKMSYQHSPAGGHDLIISAVILLSLERVDTKVLNPPPRFTFLQSLVPMLIKHLNQLIKLFGFSCLEINCRKENLQYHRQAFLDLFALDSVYLSVKWQLLYVGLMLDQKNIK